MSSYKSSSVYDAVLQKRSLSMPLESAPAEVEGACGCYQCPYPECLARLRYSSSLRRHMITRHSADRYGRPVSKEAVTRERSHQQHKNLDAADSSAGYSGSPWKSVNSRMPTGRKTSMLDMEIEQILDEETDESALATKCCHVIERYLHRAAEAENGYSPTRNRPSYAYHPSPEIESSPATSPSTPSREEQHLFATPRFTAANKKEPKTSGRKARRLINCTIPWEEY